MFSLIAFELKQRRNGIIGWGLGGAGFALLYLTLFPSLADQVQAFEDILDLPIYQALGVSTMVTFEGYASSTFLNLVPLILSIFMVTTATYALAGEEDRGVLENIVTLQLARWQIVIAKAIALLIALILIMVIVEAGGLISLFSVKQQLEVEAGYAAFAQTMLNMFPLLFFFLMFSLWAGSFFPTRGIASMVATFLLIVSYLGNNLFDMLENLKDWKWIFPFYYYKHSPEAFEHGIYWNDFLLLSGAGLLFLAIAILCFERRNLTTRAWFWQRPKPEAIPEGN